MRISIESRITPLHAGSSSELLDSYRQVRGRLRGASARRPPSVPPIILQMRLERRMPPEPKQPTPKRDVMVIATPRRQKIDLRLPPPVEIKRPSAAPESAIWEGLTEREKTALLIESMCAIPPGTSRIKSLIRSLVTIFNLPLNAILSNRRTADLVAPRQICMAVAHRMGLGSYPHIGRAFGRDHTTVLHAVRKKQEMINEILVTEYPELLGARPQ